MYIVEHEHGNQRNGTIAGMEHASLAASAAASNQRHDDDDDNDDNTRAKESLWNPEKDFNMTYPKALSPSAINEFLACPQSFLFQYIYNLRQPTSLALAKGSFCHEALEQVFDLDAADRTLEHLQNLFRKAWSQQRQKEPYAQLFLRRNKKKRKDDDNDDDDDVQWDLEAEAQWGREALQLLENYVHYEDPRHVTRPNPVQREVWVQAQLTLDPTQGKTGYVVSPSSRTTHATSHSDMEPDDNSNDNNNNTEGTFLVRGIVDRLDMVRDKETNAIVMRLTDYKTGKAPELKYSVAMNDKIVAQNFFQLQIYALLLREKQIDREHSMDLRYLRLLYLTSAQGPAVAWDYDMGATEAERDFMLQQVHAKLSQVWMDIVQLVSQQDPRLWQGCDRSFCYCHKCRSKFLPGTVWEPPSLD